MDAFLQTTIAGIPLAFLWTAILIELTPGPNMSYLAVLSLAEGRRAGLAAVAGVALGLLIIGVVAALGLAAAISQSPALYQILRWAGVAYLVWLAYDIWTNEEQNAQPDGSPDTGLLLYFARGLITNLLNPKAAIFYVAVLPPFIDPDRPILPQTLALSVAYVAVATTIHLAIVTLAAEARKNLQNQMSLMKLRRALAVSVLMIAVWLIWSTRHAAH
ncbi:MAG TPA: LysE family translocator [Hyphomicrobium sp.]|nr:LysE family translocator [Hyphomicrobium sp.]